MLPIFQDKKLETVAFTHRSALNEYKELTESNERMEFLGDAVLELSSSIYLFSKYPSEPEGVLTAYRSSLVKTTTLAAIAKTLGIGEKIVMSKGEEQTGGRDNEALLADTFEAIVGALYLDQGFDAADAFLKENLFPLIEEIKEKQLYKDSKSLLQEYAQSVLHAIPIYSVLKEEGPDHQKTFTIAVTINKERISVGMGKSKQDAQQQAAQIALEKLQKS